MAIKANDSNVGNQDGQVKDLGGVVEAEEKKDGDIFNSESEESNVDEEKVEQEDATDPTNLEKNTKKEDAMLQKQRTTVINADRS